MATRKIRKGDDDSSSKKDGEDKFKENQFKSRKSVSKADGDDDDDDKKPWEKSDDGDDDDCKSRKSVRKADDDDDDDDKKPWEKSDDGDDDDCKSRKSVRKADGDDDEDDDDDEDMNKKAKKSLTTGDLKKSMRMLKGFLDENDPTSRKDYLLSKAQGDGKLKKSERRELLSLMEGEDSSSRRPESMAKAMNANETIQKSFDVTDFLHELTGELCKSHDSLSERLAKSQNSQGEFNIVLAKSVAAVGAQQLAVAQLLKSVAERIGVIEAQPARGPKSQGVQALEKGFAGGAAQGQNTPNNGLNKSQVLGYLTAMNEQSHQTGREGMSKSGEDLAHAISKYESTNIISKGLESELRDHVRSTRQSNRAN